MAFSDSNRLELVIDVTATKGNAEIAGVNRNLGSMEKAAILATQRSSRGLDGMVMSMARANLQSGQLQQQMALLGSQFGVSLPGAVSTFVGKLPVIPGLMSKAFNASVVLFLAQQLISLGVEAKKFIDEQVRLSGQETFFGFLATNIERSLAGLRALPQGLEAARRAATGEGAGMTAEQRVHRDATAAASFARAEQLQRQTSLLGVSGVERARLEAGFRVEDARKAAAFPAEMGAVRGLNRATISAAAEAQRDANLKIIVRMQETAREGAAKIIEQEQDDFSRRVALESAHWVDRQKASIAGSDRVREIVEQAEHSRLDPNHRALKQIELNELTRVREMQVLYNEGLVSAREFEDARLALAVTAASEHREVIRGYASELESMFDRVVGSVRSAGDLLKNITREVTNYVKRYMSETVASIILGGRQAIGTVMTGVSFPGSGGGSQFAGIAGAALPGIFGGGIPGIGPGGTPPFIPGSVGGGVSGAAGLGGLGGLSGLLSTTTLGAGLLLGGPLAGLGIGQKIGGGLGGAIGGGIAATSGIAGLGLLSGLGILAGFNPIGAAIIGGAIGIGALIGHFRKSADKKLREKIKATYGVDISDKGILTQIVQMAKQTFGGNLDMAIRSAPIVELIQLYSMIHGQNDRGLPAPMRPSSLVQMGGGIFQQPGFEQGRPLPILGGSFPSLGAGRSTEITIVVQNSLPSDRVGDYMEGKVVETILKVPRVVSQAVNSGMRSSSGRREATALQLAPGLLTS